MKVGRQGPNAVVCQGGPFDGQSIVVGDALLYRNEDYPIRTVSPDEHGNPVFGSYTVDPETRVAVWEAES